MRMILLMSLMIGATGCGKKSGEQTTAAGIPLSINNTDSNGETAVNKKTDQPLANPAVEQLIKKAKAAVTASQPAIAIEALSQAIGLSPNESRLFRLRADVYVLSGEFASAKADFALAISQDPENADLRNVRGYFLMTRGSTDEAVADFNKAIELDPQLAVAWNNRGLISLAKREYTAAESDFTKAIERNRKYADAWNNRGFVRMKVNQYDAALTDLKESLKHKPDYTTAWNNCGLVHMHQENYQAAADAFTEAIKLAPMDLRWLAHRRSALLKLDKHTEASADARRIRWLAGLNKLTSQALANSRKAEVWIKRAAYLFEGSEYGAAVQDYSRALAVEPGNTDALTGRAKAWLNTGEHQKAIKDCDESLMIAASTGAYSTRGDAWFMLKNFDQAVQDFEAAQRFDQKVATAYRNRAVERRKNGKDKLAADDEAKATNIEAGLAGNLNSDDGAQPPPFPAE